MSWLDKKNWKLSNLHCANLWARESVRSRCMVPYQWDIFIFELGASPYRPVPYRWGITVWNFSQSSCWSFLRIIYIDVSEKNSHNKMPHLQIRANLTPGCGKYISIYHVDVPVGICNMFCFENVKYSIPWAAINWKYACLSRSYEILYKAGQVLILEYNA